VAGTRDQPTGVGLPDHVGVQQLHERVQVAARGRGDEPLGDAPLLGGRDGEAGRAALGLNAMAGSAGQLRHANGERPTIEPTASKENPKTSWSTNAVRSAEVSRSSTTSSAMRTLSSSVTWSAGSTLPPCGGINGSGSHGPT
jgi:hypothetical protein